MGFQAMRQIVAHGKLIRVVFPLVIGLGAASRRSVATVTRVKNRQSGHGQDVSDFQSCTWSDDAPILTTATSASASASQRC